MATALTIAGSDSGGGAGIQADLKTFAAHGVYGTSAIAAVTAQNTVGVTGWMALPESLVTAQIDAVLEDIGADAVKTGMLGTANLVRAVADALARWRAAPLVVDPVMVAKSGDRLIDDAAVDALKAHLLPLATVLTPNRPEAEVLLGRPLAGHEAARGALSDLAALGPRAVVLKGGHFEGNEVVDLLYVDGDIHEVRHPRIVSRHTHGTGCTFASAVAARLALGADIPAAVRLAVEYVSGAIRHGLAIGRGHGPLDHFWQNRT